MSRQAVRRLLALAAVAFYTAASASSLLAQGGPREDWERVRYGVLQIDVRKDFKIYRGFRPLFIFQGQQINLNFITATDESRGLFVWAGYHFSPCGMNYDMAKYILENSCGLDLPGIGTFKFTSSQSAVSKHTTIGAPVRETTGRRLVVRRRGVYDTGEDYRIYYAFKPPECSANLSFIVMGFPENEIEKYSRVMSAILASFRLN